uniref:KRAB domain-containing protein n=1 Tax=Anolis carolinensis TaxID=28377 RepID=A0A803TLX6_ANOCA
MLLTRDISLQYLFVLLSKLLDSFVTFEDVSVDFSEDEWALLDLNQKALHQQIMEENLGIVTTLGKFQKVKVSSFQIHIGASHEDNWHLGQNSNTLYFARKLIGNQWSDFRIGATSSVPDVPVTNQAAIFWNKV